MAEFFDINRFEVDIRENLTMTDTYQEVGNTEMLDAELGCYEFGYSGVHSYDQINKSEYMRFSLDGGTTWQELIREPANTLDIQADSYQFYIRGISGDLSFIVQARAQDATGTMEVYSVNVWIKRVS